MRVIAIDGPAGAGKSTVARGLAARLGLAYLDTGAMYRGVTFAALRRGIDPDDADRVAHLVLDLEMTVTDTATTVDGVDASVEIRGPEVTRAVSIVAANPAVRQELNRRQREWARAHNGGVIEGRDIGSVVFPRAEVKVYLTASAEERARRRNDEAPEGVARRDRIDSTREASPLREADDAHRLDTTGRSVEDVVEEVLSWL